MGVIMVNSLLWVMQGLYYRNYQGLFIGVFSCRLFMLWAPKQLESSTNMEPRLRVSKG